jgi:hypothetical protein
MFRRKWSGASEIRSVHRFEAPDFRGQLMSSRQFGLEVATVTDEKLAKDDKFVRNVFVAELKRAAAAASVTGAFFAAFAEYDATRLRIAGHRKRVITGLLDLAQDPARPKGVIRRPELLSRGLDALMAASLEPSDQGITVITGRNARGRGTVFVQDCIAAKDAKVPLYRSRIPPGAELWLLLVSGASFASGVSVPPADPPFETAFDRVFFLDCTDRWRFNSVLEGPAKDQVVELPVRRPQEAGEE